MGIRRHASCNAVTVSTAAAVVALIVAVVGSVPGRHLSLPTADAGSPASASSAQGAGPPVASSDPAHQTKYQMALERFKAGAVAEAEGVFGELADGEDAPFVVRACSLNMLGQMAWLGGERQKARDAFNRLSMLLEPAVVNESRSADSALVRLFGTACIRIAERSELEANPGAAIAEYERVLRASARLPDDPWLNGQRPWLMDKVAQLKLSMRDLDGYLQYAERLRREHPAYERAVLVGLEADCIRFLQQSGGPAVVPQKPDEAPAWAIAHVRGHAGGAARLRDIAASACPKPPRTCAELVVCYHAAWMFDALGDIEESARHFSQVASANIPAAERSFIADTMTETVQAYARIQHAILLAEGGRYDEALRGLASSSRPAGTHVATLTEAAKKNIETLKREVLSHGKQDQ